MDVCEVFDVITVIIIKIRISVKQWLSQGLLNRGFSGTYLPT
jgi:hypothetical protein